MHGPNIPSPKPKTPVAGIEASCGWLDQMILQPDLTWGRLVFQSVKNKAAR